MKTYLWPAAICLALANPVLAQTAPDADAVPPVQAPPALNDPGVTQQAPAPAGTAQRSGNAPAATPASDASTLPPDVQAAANVAELPVVTVRQNGNETIKEYRKNGKLLFRAVLNSQEPTRIYVDNPAVIPPSIMQQLSGPSGQVQPVYYKLADWK